MKKRKLDINEIKKLALRGRQSRAITTKYEVLLSFFKRKNGEKSKIFDVSLQSLVADLVDQLSNAEITYKIQNQLHGQLHTVEITPQALKIDISCLKNICKQFPVPQLMECIQIGRDSTTNKISVSVMNSKLMVFFKHLRTIFPEFCYSTGEKTIVQLQQLRTFYQTFKCQWNKIYERGRMDSCQKIEKLLCRSIYFFGALIENNILIEIAEQERLKKQQATDISTKSQKKPTFKVIHPQVSSTYSFGGEVDLISNLSSGFMTQKSNQQSFCKTGYSEKSQRVTRKDRNCQLFDVAEIKNLKIMIAPSQQQQKVIYPNRFQIDLLSNDVENIYIQQAFKIERVKHQYQSNHRYQQHIVHNNHYIYPNHNYQQAYYPQYYQPNFFSPLLYTQILGSEQNRPQNKRTYNNQNLVETRKTYSRLQNKKDYS